MSDFFQAVRQRVPEIEGFQPVMVDGQPGIRILKPKGHFSEGAIKAIESAVDQVARDAKIAAEITDFNADVEIAKNDWSKDPQGGSYLSRLGETGRPGLPGRLVGEHGPAVAAAIQKAFEQHAPEALERPARARVEAPPKSPPLKKSVLKEGQPISKLQRPLEQPEAVSA